MKKILHILKRIVYLLLSPHALRVYILKAFHYLRRYGFKAVIRRIGDWFNARTPNDYIKDYPKLISISEPSKRALNKQRKRCFEYEPLISIAVPVYNTNHAHLKEMIDSVLCQTYSKWQLIMADTSDDVGVKNILREYQKFDNRIRIVELSENKGIALNTNEAIKNCDGEYICLLDHDDRLSEFALYEIVSSLNLERASFLYSDEDKLYFDGSRVHPHFKPDYSPDTLRSHNYICHLSIIKKSLGESVGWLREGFDGAQDYELILRLCEKADKIVHIPKVLYHWRISDNSTALDACAKPYSHNAGARALEEHLKRIGRKGHILEASSENIYRVSYEIEGLPLVSVIVPNKDLVEDLSRLIDSLEKSSYKNIEVVIVENNSEKEETFAYYKKIASNNVRVETWEGKGFNFSALCNFGASKTRGEYLLFLNNDIEIIDNDLIETMLSHAQMKEVGGVGAKLYFPDDTIQHAGLIVGITGSAAHVFRGAPRYGKCQNMPNIYEARVSAIQNISAVTAACFMLRKSVYEEVGGFDEEFAVAYNDVDICLKIREKGYLIIYTPYAQAYHYESKTRGYEDNAEKLERFYSEHSLLRKKHPKIFKDGDPYYNPNYSLLKDDFSLRI